MPVSAVALENRSARTIVPYLALCKFNYGRWRVLIVGSFSFFNSYTCILVWSAGINPFLGLILDLHGERPENVVKKVEGCSNINAVPRDI